ncbi:MAG TPA: GNA1162 family protein [Thiobacillus sp.]
MKIVSSVLILAVLTGCVAQPIRQDMSAFHAAAPRSILVVPTVNKSLDVDAPNYVLAALPVPVANKGYYVFPVNTTKYVLEQEGFYEGERIHQMATPDLAKLFGADAVLYVSINRWDAQYAFITTVVTVEFDYRLVSKDGAEIWKESKRMQYQPQNNNSGSPIAMLIVAAVNAAVTRAAPNYMPLTRQANHQVFISGVNAIPDGPYRPAASKQ